VEVDERTVKLVEPVNGDPGLTVLRVLGLGQAGSPFGVAAHGPNGVAAGLWRNPELYVVRWIKGKRWVVGYRLAGASRLSDYVASEGRVPTRMETGNWYGSVPDTVSEAFFEAGIILDDPPFPVPAAPPERRTVVASRGTAKPVTRQPRSTGTTANRKAAASKPPAAPSTRLCPGCRMHKRLSQFVAGSDSCVDCR
ncbi:MAG: hypothetical protein ABR540_13935, partial [Acidimicrobiales bacterium]